jgi:glycosyltransferase involved in cell wall biosynthesis
VSSGSFEYEYLSGFQVGQTRIAPGLPWKLLRTPFDVYVKCINGKFALPLTYLVARLRRKPFVLWTGIWIRLRTPTHRLLWPLTRYFYRRADAIVTYGTHVRDFLQAEGIDPVRIFPARHAIDNDLFGRSVSADEKAAVRERLQLAPSDRVILFVGRLVEVKGLTYLLEAFARVRAPGILVLVGQGPEEAALRSLAERLGIAGRVRFAGYVRSADTVPYYAIAWAHVLTSITMEGRETWGLVVNEAFNQGVPSIASDATGAAAGGLVVHGETGFVVPERDVAALAECLERILADESLRNRLGERARQKVAGWSNEAMTTAFLDAIHYATGRRPETRIQEGNDSVLCAESVGSTPEPTTRR